MSEKKISIFKNVPSIDELIQLIPGLETILFDMDGTLFDTEKYHAEALFKLGSKLQINAPVSHQELYEIMVGKADHLLFEIIRHWQGFPSSWSCDQFVNAKNAQLLEILSLANPQQSFHPELRKLIHDAQKQKIKLGLVTSSEKVITLELIKIHQLQNSFQIILTRDDSLKVKPDPWPYLHAMEKLDVKNFNTIIFEDSAVGLKAASESGAHVIKVEWY
jgi:beta-phosphoglucomutase